MSGEFILLSKIRLKECNSKIEMNRLTLRILTFIISMMAWFMNAFLSANDSVGDNFFISNEASPDVFLVSDELELISGRVEEMYFVRDYTNR